MLLNRLVVLALTTILPAVAQIHNRGVSPNVEANESEYAHAPTVLHLRPDGPAESEGWSGYLVTINKPASVTDVKGSWIVPAVTCTLETTTSGVFVGIDGTGTVKNQPIEQIGTESNCRNGRAIYKAWYEFFPAEPVPIGSLTIKPGDQIFAEVKFSNGQFTLMITDYGGGGGGGAPFATLPTPVTGAARETAEWIVEAPGMSSGKVLPLADFGTVFVGHDYTPLVIASTCEATVAGQTSLIGNFPPASQVPIKMVNNHGTIAAVPSPLSDESSFSVVTTCAPAPSGLVGWWPGDGNANDIIGGNNGTLQGGATYTPAASWQPSRAYALGDEITDDPTAVTPGDHIQKVTTAGTSGTRPPTWNDSGGSTIDGTVTWADQGDSGFVAQAFSFDGLTGYVQIPSSSALQPPSAISITAWVYPAAIVNGGTIVSKYDDTGLGQSWFLGTLSTGQLEWEVYDGQSDSPAVTVDSLNTGSWQFVAATFDGATQTWAVYINGALVNTTCRSGYTCGPVGPISQTAAPVLIGATPTGSAPGYWSGLIDEVQVFNRALSASEISGIYNAGRAGVCK